MKSVNTLAGLLALSLLASAPIAADEVKVDAAAEKKADEKKMDDKAGMKMDKKDEKKASHKKVAKMKSDVPGPDAHYAYNNSDWRHFDTNKKFDDRMDPRYPHGPHHAHYGYNDGYYGDPRYDGRWDERYYDGRYNDGRYYDDCRGGWGRGHHLTGFFIGLQAGMNGLSTRDDFNRGTAGVGTNKGGNFGGLGGVFLGWGRHFSKHGYIGLQLEGNLIDAKRDVTNTQSGVTQTITTKTSGVWGAAVLFGFRPWASHRTMIYVRLGADYARWKLSGTNTGSTAATSITGSTSSNTLAFAPGLGVRSMMYKNMFWNMEYKYSFFKKLTLNNAAGTSASSKPRLQTFTVGIGWRF